MGDSWSGEQHCSFDNSARNQEIAYLLFLISWGHARFHLPNSSIYQLFQSTQQIGQNVFPYLMNIVPDSIQYVIEPVHHSLGHRNT